MKEMPTAPPLRERVAPLLENLLYPSESDEPVQFLYLPWNGVREITAREFTELSGLEASEEVTEKVPERFWLPVTVERQWYGDEERERTAQFVELRSILEESLEHIQYFEVGAVEIELYLIGQSNQSIMGIKTTSVRT